MRADSSDSFDHSLKIRSIETNNMSADNVGGQNDVRHCFETESRPRTSVF